MKKVIIMLLAIAVLGIQKITAAADCIAATQDGVHYSSLQGTVGCNHDCHHDSHSKILKDGTCSTCRHRHDTPSMIFVKVSPQNLRRRRNKIHKKIKKRKRSIFAISLK